MIETCKKWKLSQWNKSPNAACLKRIIKKLCERNYHGSYSHFHHIYSHLLDNKPTCKKLFKKWKRKIDCLHKKFRKDTLRLLQANQNVNRLSNSKITDVDSYLSPYTPELSAIQVFDSNFKTIEGNLLKAVQKHLNTKNQQKWKERCPKRTLFLQHPTIDWKLSILPFGEKDSHQSLLTNFRHKLPKKFFQLQVLLVNRFFFTIKTIIGPKTLQN